MVEKILFGFGVVGKHHPIGPGQRFFAKDLEQRTCDPDKAKHYLKQAGMDSLAVDLSVADAAFAGAVDAGALFAESARVANININLIREPNDGGDEARAHLAPTEEHERRAGGVSCWLSEGRIR